MSHTNFLGIPVEGNITRGNKRTDQKPVEELQPLLQAVLDDPAVVEFGWEQYTPYFNDGEPCEFRVYEPWFRTVFDIGVANGDEELNLDFHRTLGTRHYDSEKRAYVDLTRSIGVIATADRCKALADAFESDAFDDVLLEAFGDHAEVIVKREGITVTFYEHE